MSDHARLDSLAKELKELAKKHEIAIVVSPRRGASLDLVLHRVSHQ